jgi:hypothetical protein
MIGPARVLTGMSFALLGLLLLATEPDVPVPEAEAAEEPEPPPPVWEIYVGANGGLRVDQKSGGGGVMLGVNRKFVGFLRPELLVATGAYDAPFDYVIQIRIGARFELPLASPWKPYLWTAFAHNHESAMLAVKDDPLGHLFGLSEHGVHHRSGLELGLGLAYEVPRLTKWKIATRVGTRLTFAQFFGDSGPPRYLDFTMTVGVAI